jgi:hypothetical protein
MKQDSAIKGLQVPAATETARTPQMGHKIRTEIDIAASPQTVWEILTGLEQYQDWNPLITSSSGVVAVGEKLTNRLELPGGKVDTRTVRVTAVEPSRLFEWNGRLLGLALLFQGQHRLELEDTPNGARLTHSEEFSGLAAPLILRRTVVAQIEEGFRMMNNALKARAEAQANT